MLNTHQMNALKRKAREAFDTANGLNIPHAEGAAILTTSGLFLSGYTQPEANKNAAADALRAVSGHSLSAVLVVSAEEKIHPATIETLKHCFGTPNASAVFHARPSTPAEGCDVRILGNVPI